MTTKLDVTGHKCPIPVLRVRRVLERLSVGDELVVETTDPMSELDIPHFCEQTGQQLLDMQRKGEKYVFLLKKCVSHNPET